MLPLGHQVGLKVYNAFVRRNLLCIVHRVRDNVFDLGLRSDMSVCTHRVCAMMIIIQLSSACSGSCVSLGYPSDKTSYFRIAHLLPVSLLSNPFIIQMSIIPEQRLASTDAIRVFIYLLAAKRRSALLAHKQIAVLFLVFCIDRKYLYDSFSKCHCVMYLKYFSIV